jgi:hypothetical protein
MGVFVKLQGLKHNYNKLQGLFYKNIGIQNFLLLPIYFTKEKSRLIWVIDLALDDSDLIKMKGYFLF